MSKQTDLINIPDAITVSGSNVGIGTSSPTLTAGATGVDIYDNSDAQIRLHNSTTGTTASDGLLISLASDNAGYFYNYENAPVIVGTNNSERMRVTAAGSVGINTSSVDSYYAKKLVVDCGTDGQNGITIKSSTTGAGMFAFADGTSGSDRYRGYINYNHADDSMTLGTAGGSGLLGIDATGRVTTPSQPAFEAYGNNSNYISVSTVGAGYYIPFSNAVTNIGNHYNSSTYKFTAPVAGMYHFYSAVYTRTGPATEDIYTRWVVNNSSNKGYSYFYNVTGSEIHNTVTDSIDIYLNANDYIGVTINGAGGADMYTGFQECRFSGYLIG